MDQATTSTRAEQRKTHRGLLEFEDVDLVRLDADKIDHLDLTKKQYTEQTFEELRARMQQALDKAQDKDNKDPGAAQESQKPMDDSKCEWLDPKVDVRRSLTRRNVCTPKPSIVAKLRGSARSDISHNTMCIASGCSDTKSQNESCADDACGIS